MFFIFKILPDWIWGLALLSGILAFLLSYLPQAKLYALPLKIVGGMVVAATIFIFGMLYCDNTWKQAAQELQARVDVAEAKSQTVNETIKEKVVYKTQVITKRGSDNVQFIDREVVKYDTTCVLPKEFVQAHNRAAEQPK